MIEKNNKPIAFLDSGVGGISVLNEAIKLMPNENYLYFGDSKNAPYGTKETRKVRELTQKNVEFLLEQGAKAVVIACNTATSAAAEYLRNKYKDIPIIGVEPALKPAVLNNEGKRILVMATPMTLAEKKFKNLMRKYENSAEIISIPCGGLMEFVEEGTLQGETLENFLRQILDKDLCNNTAAVVLGCTHYPFIKDIIAKIIGSDIQIYDGGYGTAKQLQRRLNKKGILTTNNRKGCIKVINSLKDEKVIRLSKKLIKKEENYYGEQ